MFRPTQHGIAQLSRLFSVLLCALFAFAICAAAAVAGPQYRGAQVHSLWSTVSSSEMTQELNALQNAGVNVLRVDVGWATLETSKGGYDSAYLAKLDALSAGAHARGIKIIATLWQTPRWASSGGAWNDAPSNPADFGAFAQFVTSRYGSELAAVEVWNEPEINENLIAANLAETYVQMVEAVYAGAKAGGPGIPVLAGSLAYADIPFLRELYADGMQGYYDGISMHPYADGAAPANTAVTHSFLGGIESLHAAQVAAGDDTPEWVTEFGWPTGTSAGANTEQQQAEYTEQAFALLNGIPYVEGATVYELRDMETDASDPEDNFGMLGQNFAPRPAYAALKAAMQDTTVPTPVSAEVGLGKPESPPDSSSSSSGSGPGSSASGANSSGGLNSGSSASGSSSSSGPSAPGSHASSPSLTGSAGVHHHAGATHTHHRRSDARVARVEGRRRTLRHRRKRL